MTASGTISRVSGDAGRRHLIVVRAGESSLHRNWLAGRERRIFDLLISYYGPTRGRYAADGDLYHAMVGTRWPGHAAIFAADPALTDRYDRVCFACDDLDADVGTWNRLFRRCADYELDLAQPAILGPTSYDITAPVEGLLYRQTMFVEVMCPVFSRDALRVCRPTFAESVSGWGLDRVWPKLVTDAGGRLGIIDSVRVTHTREVREGSLYRLLEDMGVDPFAENQSVMARYGVEDADLREIARVVDRPNLLERLRRYGVSRLRGGSP